MSVQNPFLSNPARAERCFVNSMGIYHKLLFSLLLLLVCATYAHAAVPAGYSEYYIPGDEEQLALIWGDIGQTGGIAVTGANATRHTIISVVAWSDNTTVYYDHWENGYNFDPNDPTSADETYTLNKGESKIFDSTGIPVYSRGTGTYYDGGDHIYVAGGVVSVTRMSWNDNAGTVFSIATEVYPVKPQMTTYILPFGEDLAATYRSFDRVYALIQATQDNTVLQFDVNADGTNDTICVNREQHSCSFLDNFGGGYTTNNGTCTWPAGWQEVGEADGAGAGRVSVTGGQLQLQGNNPLAFPRGAYRITDLSSAPSATIVFDGIPAGLAAGDIVTLDTSTNSTNGINGTWNTLATFNGTAQSTFTAQSFAIPAAYLSATTYVRLAMTGGYQANTKYFRADRFHVDATANCVQGTSVTLNKGQSFMLDDYALSPQSAPYNVVHTGTVINSSNTIQVDYIIGNHSDTYQGRAFAAFPRGYWDTEYYVPVDSSAGTGSYPTNIYLYNPNSSAITINYQTSTGSGSFSLPANTTSSFQTLTGNYVPQGSGVYLKGSDVFWGVTEIDDGGQTHEWGHSLIPSFLLSNEQYIGWAPSGTTPSAGNADDAGIYISPAQDNTMVYVDTNNDGVADQTFTLNRMQSQYVYNAVTGDMSNSHFWATGPITLAYGQNPATAPTGAPAIDVGYGIFPGGDWIDKVLTVSDSANPVVVSVVSGATSTYTVTVNSYYFSVNSINVVDTLPAGWQFVNDSATITLANLTSVSGASANPSIAGQTLTWSNALLGSMAANQNITITFAATTTQTFSAGDITMNQVEVAGTRAVGGLSQIFTSSAFANNTFSAANSGLTVTKNSCVLGTSCTALSGPLYPGNSYTYRVQVTNPPSSTSIPTGIAISDPLPAGVTYSAGSGSVTCDIPRNVRDEFATAAYNNTNGSVSWAANAWTEANDAQDLTTGDAAGGVVRISGGALQLSNYRTVADTFASAAYTRNDGTTDWSGAWTETDSTGASQSPTAGYIRVNGGRLQINNTGAVTTQSISRGIDLTGTGATTATLTFDYTTSGNLENADVVNVQYRTGGGAWTTFAGGTYSNDVTGSASFTIPLASPANLTEIRFAITANTAYTTNNEFFYVSNLAITYNANPPSIQRTANLTGASSAKLKFDYSSVGLVAGDTLVVEASLSSGGTYTTLATFTGGTPDVAPSYDITPYISATTTIRFRVTGGFDSVGKTFNVDNVDIIYFVPPSSSTFAAGSPPNFLSSGAGCALAPGGSLTLTYNVTVNDPLATGITSITNTASVNSNESILPLSASVTDAVSVPSSGSAEVGEKVWLDSNGNGVLDLGEPGLSNVEVTLKDQYGTPLMTATTDATGHYLFTGVTPGNGYYVEATSRTLPAGVQQSAPGGHSDNRTGAFNLTAGQSYASANLGYEAVSTSAIIGHLVWSDANSNGVRDAGEPGLAGVTVQLWLDTDSNGIFSSGTDTLVMSATTAPDGSYLFTGVPANGAKDYFIRIDEAQAALSGYTRTTPATVPIYIQDVAAGSSTLSANFGYHGASTYSIKDRVWLDADANGSQNGGETGIAAVTVDLLDSSLNAIATTTTNSSGDFTFSGLIGGGADYTIKITDTGATLANYYGTTTAATAGSELISNLTATVDHSSTPHFGYNVNRTIGTTVFNDANGNGIQDAGEVGISGVTVKLYSDAGTPGVIDGTDAVLTTLTTDANGKYLFSGLSDGNYIVSIEPTPSGYIYTGIGGNADSDTGTVGQQQAATLTGGVSVLTGNFPYRALTPRSVSGLVWQDLNGNGAINGGEGYFAGVTIDLLNAGGAVIATTSTAADGTYSFNNLVTSPSGTYTVKITDTSGVLSGYDASYEITEGIAGPFDGQESVDLSGGDATGINFGFYSNPTRVKLLDFRAYEKDGAVYVRWETASEQNTLGFNLLRQDRATGKFAAVNPGLMPGIFKPYHGGIYTLRDDGDSAGGTYTYKLVEVETSGRQLTYGPFTVSVDGNSPADASAVSASSGYDRRDKEDTTTQKASKQAGLTALTAVKAVQKIASGDLIKITVPANGVYYVDSRDISTLLGLSRCPGPRHDKPRPVVPEHSGPAGVV